MLIKTRIPLKSAKPSAFWSKRFRSHPDLPVWKFHQTPIRRLLGLPPRGRHLVLICTDLCLWGAVIFTLSGSIFLNLSNPAKEKNYHCSLEAKIWKVNTLLGAFLQKKIPGLGARMVKIILWPAAHTWYRKYWSAPPPPPLRMSTLQPLLQSKLCIAFDRDRTNFKELLLQTSYKTSLSTE